jgi:hypothetical protein
MELLPRVAEIGFWQTWHSRRAAFLARSMARRFWSLFQSSLHLAEQNRVP